MGKSKLSNLYNRIARIISTLFVPPSLNLLLFIFLGINVSSDLNMLITILTFSLLLGFIFPIIFFIKQRKKGIVSDIDITIKEERNNSYIFAVILSGIGFAGTNFLLEIGIITTVWLIYLISSILILIINRFWKISAHTLGASIPTGVLFCYDTVLSIYMLPILLSVGWSRLALCKHTILQVFVGAILGLLISAIVFYMVV